MTTRRNFIVTAAVLACPFILAMTPMQRLVLFTPPALSPTAAAIVAALQKQNTPPSPELVRWIVDAVQAVNSRRFVVMATAPDATAMSFTVQGQGMMRIFWGDGRTDRYQLTDTAQVISHSYQAPGKRAVVMVGNVVLVE